MLRMIDGDKRGRGFPTGGFKPRGFGVCVGNHQNMVSFNAWTITFAIIQVA